MRCRLQMHVSYRLCTRCDTRMAYSPLTRCAERLAVRCARSSDYSLDRSVFHQNCWGEFFDFNVCSVRGATIRRRCRALLPNADTPISRTSLAIFASLQDARLRHSSRHSPSLHSSFYPPIRSARSVKSYRLTNSALRYIR